MITEPIHVLAWSRLRRRKLLRRLPSSDQSPLVGFATLAAGVIYLIIMGGIS
ncbi:MAG: hypothetical protein QM669_12295 [Siphonobacter sp.]